MRVTRATGRKALCAAGLGMLAAAAALMAGPSDEGRGTLTGVTWRVTEIAGHAAPVHGQASLTIRADGRYALAGACNGFAGTLTHDAPHLRFTNDMLGSLAVCPEPAMTVDRQVTQALHQTRRYALTAQGLTLQDADGTTLMRLTDRDG